MDSSGQSAVAVKLTDEQQQVVASDSAALKVVAFAGTGKTSTLRAYAAARPRESILYVAFNAATSREAAATFPRHVECRTTHSIAYRAVGKDYQHKLANSSLALFEVARALKANVKSNDGVRLARAALSELNGFLASAAYGFEEYRAARETDSEVSKAAEKLWALMTDPASEDLRITHDGYLKLFQITRPRLRFDRILFDEAQDANPVTLEIIRTQEAAKVFVGDPHQQIYSFRGAENAMDDPLLVDSLYLTHSFRFSNGIAEVANGILALKRERARVVGVRTSAPSQSRAFISRGNAALFLRAVECARQGTAFHVNGGVQGIRLDVLMDVWLLWARRRGEIKDPFLRTFLDVDQLRIHATRVEDRELKAWLGVVDRHARPADIPDEIALVQTEARTNAHDALVLTTTHKAKGLEYGAVELADDFPQIELVEEPDPRQRSPRYPRDWRYSPEAYPSLWNQGGFCPVVLLPNEEVNLRYVAATRAEAELTGGRVGNPPFRKLADWLRQHPSFLWFETAKDVELRRRADGPAFRLPSRR